MQGCHFSGMLVLQSSVKKVQFQSAKDSTFVALNTEVIKHIMLNSVEHEVHAIEI